MLLLIKGLESINTALMFGTSYAKYMGMNNNEIKNRMETTWECPFKVKVYGLESTLLRYRSYVIKLIALSPDLAPQLFEMKGCKLAKADSQTPYLAVLLTLIKDIEQNKLAFTASG